MMPHPGRKYGVSTGNRKPCSDIGKWWKADTAIAQLIKKILQSFTADFFTNKPGKSLKEIVSFKKCNAHFFHRQRQAAKLYILMKKTAVEEGGIQVSIYLKLKRFPLFAEYPSCKFCVLNRIVHAVPDNLVIFDQTMIRIFRKGKGR